MPGTRYRFACPSGDRCLPEQSLERQSQEDVFQLQTVSEAGLLPAKMLEKDKFSRRGMLADAKNSEE
jgi:hypothetical protein